MPVVTPGPGFVDPGPGFVPPPKKADKFDLKPVGGTVPAISPPPNLPADGAALELDLGGRAGAVTVAGGGRYIVVHVPDRGLLGLFDASKGLMAAAGDTDRGDVRLAGGLDRLVTFAEVGGKKQLRSYSIPDLRPQFEWTLDREFFFAPKGVAMGNRTNGPAVVCDTFGGEVALFDLSPSGAKEVEGARKKVPGMHGDVVKAFPDGTAYVIHENRNPQQITLLTETGRDWKVTTTRLTPFPSADGLLFGNGVVNDKQGRDARFGGVVANSGWLVPATTDGNYFMKLAPTTIPATPRPKKAIGLTFHSNRNVATPVAGAPVLAGTPELEGFSDFNGHLQHDVIADQHFFLIPEAKLLVVMNRDRTKLFMRKVELR